MDLREKLDEELMVPLWPTAGRVLGLGRDGVYNGVKNGHIPAVRIGRSLRVPTIWLRKVAGLPVEASSNKTEAQAA